MSYTLATMQQCMAKAGANVNSGLSGSTLLSAFCDEAEGQITFITRNNWVTQWSSISGSAYAGIISDTVSDLVAMKAINYDMSGYTSRAEAQTMLDVLRDNINRNMEKLQLEEHKEVF